MQPGGLNLVYTGRKRNKGFVMRKFIATLSAFALVIPTTVVPISSAEAQTRSHSKHYKSRSTRHYQKCRHSKGTTGLVAGGVLGAVAGPAIIGHGLLGAAAGGVGGALGGRAIDRTITAKKRCR
jgi:outer membrane lipoprotein SlyB